MISFIREFKLYFRLFRPHAIKLVDKLIYLFAGFISIILVIPYSFSTRKSIKTSICDIFPRVMLKDLLITFHGSKFIARKGKADILVLSELSEPWMTRYFKPKEGETVLDVGAHIGKYALYSSKLVGDKGCVIAIEASSENYSQLIKNIELNNFRNILALNYAAFNSNGEKMRLVGDNDGGLSLKRSSGKKELIEIVETRTIDAILEETGHTNNISHAKIDVEGAEVEVLEGMKNIISKNPNIRILIEVTQANEEAIKTILEGFEEEKIIIDNPRLKQKYYYKNDLLL